MHIRRASAYLSLSMSQSETAALLLGLLSQISLYGNTVDALTCEHNTGIGSIESWLALLDEPIATTRKT